MTGPRHVGHADLLRGARLGCPGCLTREVIAQISDAYELKASGCRPA